MLPPGAPPNLSEPGALWRAAEAAERRADAQLARQVLISLPRECPADQRLALAQAVCAPWVADGMAAQVDIHCPRASDGGEQPHAHVLLTLRRVTDSGLAATKERQWNQQFREGDGKAERTRITQRANDWLAARGINACLDARSLAAQGAGRTPEPSAPRADWQRWMREGADPEAAPRTVRAAFQHRRQRADLAAAESRAEAAQAERADLARQAQAAAQAQATAQVAQAGTRRMQRDKSAQEAPMAKQQHTTRRPPANEPWMRWEGGIDSLAEAHRQAAEAAYRRWTQGRDDLARRHTLADYVSYVQDQQAKQRARQREQAEAAADTTPEAAPQQTGPGTVAPATGAHADRTAHLPVVLAGGLQPVAPGWRVQVDEEARTITHRPPTGGAVVDHGDRLTHEGRLTPALADAVVQVAAQHRWTSLRLTGDQEYKDAVASAAALRQSPIATDHTLGREAAERVRDTLRRRAAPPPLDREAVTRLAETDPAAAARMHMDHAEAKARAKLVGEPRGSTVPADLARPRIDEAERRKATAREDAREAAAAAADHRAVHTWIGRLADPAARRRQGELSREAARLDREARRLDSGHARTVHQIEKEADKQARAHRAAHEDWRWSPPVRRAQSELQAVQKARAGVGRGEDQVTAAAAAGDLTTAARLAAAPATTEAATDLRTAAVQTAHAAERRTTGSMALAQARQTTAASLAGDPATVAAAVAGDMERAQRAAAEYAERQRREAQEQRQNRERAQRQQAAPVAAGPTT